MKTKIYSPEIVNIARIVHEANRAYCITIRDYSQVEWDLAEDWQRESAIAGVEATLSGAASTPEEQHQTWCDHKTADGWVYGETKDAEAKTHPCLVPYDHLPADQRKKDALFQAIVVALRED